MGYRFVEHTADIAFEVWGDSVSELLESASKAFYDAFIDTERLGDEDEKVVAVEAEDVDYLLYRWLNELLFLFETEFFAAKNVSVDANENSALGKLRGSRFTPDMVKVEPKAITMHKFKVEKTNGFRAFVVVDI